MLFRSPAGVADQLRARGLVLTGETTAARERARLDRGAPALAIWFHLLAGGFAVVLALAGLAGVAAVDRRRRAGDLRALRWQGLPDRVAGRAGRWSYLPVVVAALLTGAVAAGTAWWLAGDHLPIFADHDFPLIPPRWPTPVAVLGPWSVVAGTFVTAAVGLGWASRVRD